MKTKLFSTILLLVLYNYSFAQAVLYGERKEDIESLSLYFDKEGTIYPEYYISDNSLENSQASLIKWYKKNTQTFREICKQYEINADEASDENIALLQVAIVKRFVSKAGTPSDSVNSITFLIHGFRKPFKENQTDYTSIEDYKALEKSIQNLSKQKTRFVEIYWDGNYDCCIGKNIFRNKRIFRLFEDAQLNAERTGNNLRNIINNINFEKVNILTHSLGALVAVQSTFNYKPSSVETPAKKISICLIAPAIAGESVFNSYYTRNTPYDFKQKDNYRLAIAYNENDFILKKKFNAVGVNWGPGPYKYGNTTLGCNYENEAVKLKNMFNKKFANSYIELIDLSKAGSCHYLGNDCYSKGNTLENVVHFLEN
jgi:hypothetical protein